MSRKRKACRPRTVITDPLSLLRPADPERRGKVLLQFYTALEAMARGEHPGEEEWRSLSDCVNTVETLALTLGKLDPAEVMPTVNAAIAGMVGAANRFKAGQGMRLDGPGLEALRDVVDIYRQALDGLTEREMAMAQAETQRRVNALMRARKPNHQVISL
ncbi:hypothetical protein [Roseateles sp.]|uniref:hypothetical protein n=1 Tax=Roseateles sp. TaxID=1971397 RepID=UPI002DFF23EC|nr:hypothetical protein [Roseateles sp.]